MKHQPFVLTCDECVLKVQSIFRGLTRDDLEELSSKRGCSIYKKGDIVYREGSYLNGSYVINTGIIKIFKTGIEGREQIIRFGKRGDIIGFRSILSNEPACTSAKVMEDAVLCYLSTETLLSLLKSNFNFSLEVLQQSCKELREANTFITDIAQKTVRERLAEVLILLKNQFDVDNDKVLQINLTREEIANIVGTATESVIRLLSEFKNENLIDLHGRKIKILDDTRLNRIANMMD